MEYLLYKDKIAISTIKWPNRGVVASGGPPPHSFGVCQLAPCYGSTRIRRQGRGANHIRRGAGRCWNNNPRGWAISGSKNLCAGGGWLTKTNSVTFRVTVERISLVSRWC